MKHDKKNCSLSTCNSTAHLNVTRHPTNMSRFSVLLHSMGTLRTLYVIVPLLRNISCLLYCTYQHHFLPEKVQIGPWAHPTSYSMIMEGRGFSPRRWCGRNVKLTTHLHLTPRKSTPAPSAQRNFTVPHLPYIFISIQNSHKSVNFTTSAQSLRMVRSFWITLYSYARNISGSALPPPPPPPPPRMSVCSSAQ